jgi:hypothetical protein
MISLSLRSTSWSKTGSAKGGSPGHQQRRHDPVQVLSRLAADGQDDLLVADLLLVLVSGVAVRTDGGVHCRTGSAGIRYQHDGARRVAEAQPHHRLHHAPGRRLVRDGHDQVQHRCPGMRQALLGDAWAVVADHRPQGGQVVGDGRDAGVAHRPDRRHPRLGLAEAHQVAVDLQLAFGLGSAVAVRVDHGRRQDRPPRSRSSSAAGGPHEPAP